MEKIYATALKMRINDYVVVFLSDIFGITSEKVIGKIMLPWY